MWYTVCNFVCWTGGKNACISREADRCPATNQAELQLGIFVHRVLDVLLSERTLPWGNKVPGRCCNICPKQLSRSITVIFGPTFSCILFVLFLRYSRLSGACGRCRAWTARSIRALLLTHFARPLKLALFAGSFLRQNLLSRSVFIFHASNSQSFFDW